MEKIQLKPFVKWAGGKGQLLRNLQPAYPQGLGKTITKYAEPFVGGGAVLLDILSTVPLKAVYISDTNAELIHTYRTIRNSVDLLIDALSGMQKDYLSANEQSRKNYYYQKRDRFNALKADAAQPGDTATEKAALFVFLNKVCFNGLYRVNSKGFFNVPMGAYKSPCICDAENLKNVSAALKNVSIVCADYRESADFIDHTTFVYFDPPYRPLTQTASFTSYTESIFDDNAQIALAEYVKQLDKKGAKVVVSNSDGKL